MYTPADRGFSSTRGLTSGIVQPKQKAGAGALPIEDNRAQNNFWQRKNKSGLPDQLKAGVEALSGQRMDDVKVHYHSDKPAQLKAYAYAQGTDIHLGPGQEHHLPHEAWHVAQQKSGIVKPTTQLKEGVQINTDPHLEREADVMGRQVMRVGASATPGRSIRYSVAPHSAPMQMSFWINGGQVLRQETIEARVEQYRGSDEVARVLIAWAADSVVAGRQFRNWGEAIRAAQDSLGPGWKTKLAVLALILLLVFGAGWLVLFGLPGFGNQRAQDTPQPEPHRPPVLPPSLLPRIEDLRTNTNLIALHELHQNPRAEIALEEEDATPGGAEALVALEPVLEELAPVVLPKRDAIEEAATGASDGDKAGSGKTALTSENPKPLPSEVDISDDPASRTDQIKELNSEYLSKNVDVIKVVTHAQASQAGRGHPSAAVSSIEQLIRDYAGKVRIELVILAEPPAMFIFKDLLEGLDVQKDRQHLSYRNCNFTVIRQQPLSKTTSPISPIRGQQERSVSLHPDDELDLWKDDVTHVEQTKALMNAVGSQKLIGLNPHGWGDSPRFIDTGDMTYPITQSPSTIFKGGTYKDKAPGKLSPINEVIKDNIQRLVKLVRAGKIDLWTTYGLHYTDSSQGITMKHANTISSLMVMSAFHYQQSTGGKPLVILNLSKLNLDHTKAIRENDGASAEIGTVYYYKMNQPSVMTILVNKSVTFIDIVGGIPKDWFSLLVDSSTLPVTYEGANTANLAHQLGKNFLSLRDIGTTNYVEIEGFEKGHDRLMEATRSLGAPKQMPDPVLIAKVLQELNDPHSAVAQYVSEVHKRAKEPEADQVLMAIEKLRATK